MIKLINILFFIALLFISQNAFSQNALEQLDLEQTFQKLLDFESHQQLDSIKIYAADFLAATENPPSSKYRFWAFYYYSTTHYLKERKTCLDMALKAYEGFVNENDFIGIIKTANRAGNIYARSNDILNSSKYYQYGLEHAQIENNGNISDSLVYNYQVIFMNNLTINEMAVGNFDAAITLTTKAFAKGKHYTNDRHLAMTLMNLANINSRLKNYDKSIEVNRDLLALSKKIDNSQYISLALNNIAGNFGEQNQLDSALAYLQLAYKISKKRKDWNSVAFKAINLGNIHVKMKQFERADNYYTEALNIAEKYNLPHRRNHAINYIADSYLLQNRTKDALRLLHPNTKNIQLSNNKLHLLHSYKTTQEAYEMAGNYKLALDYQKKWQNLQDSIKTKEVLNNANELETKYETEKKEKQIAQLKQEQLTQQLNFQQKISLAGGATFLLLITGLFFFFKNRNQRLKDKQKATELEQRLLRSQMNPHFMFNALSSIQMHLLKSGQAQKGAYYLAKFAKLMRQILSQTRTSFISINEEVETLENYLTLQKLRYEETFIYQIKIDKTIDMASTKIPPMLIQPILENAIEHGKIYTLEHGKINIDINQSKDFLSVKIKDNGIGRNATTSINAKNHESVALEIIKDRIAILQKKYSKKVIFEINDPSEGGTEVLFILPFLEGNN